MSTLEEIFQECLDLISKRAGKNFRFAELDDLFGDCDRFFLINFLVMLADNDHEKLHQDVNVSMTLRDLINLAVELKELNRLREFRDTHEEAASAYLSSQERHEKKLSKFAADICLTVGKRQPRFNDYWILADYLGAINGTDPELNGKKLSKREALERVSKRHGIQSADAVVSHLKRYMKKTGDKFPGILP